MKFCERPWTMMYLINADKGEVWPCSWLDSNMNMGNILKQSVEELMQSENLKKLRESILDGSFRYGDCHKCTFIANNTLPDLGENEIEKIIHIEYPKEFNIAYDETCNHACPSCRSEYFKPNEDYYEKVRLINEKMLPYYNKASVLSVNGRGDIFACKHLLSMLEQLTPENEDFTLFIETNAALFDRKHWNQISHLGKYHIKVIATVNSFNDSTYRYLNGYSNHVEKVLQNLKFISSLRQQKIVDTFEMSMIVQESNFRELPNYVERCLNEFAADHVRIRGIMQFSIPEDEFWIKDVFNPAHPFYREALDILHHPIMEDPRVWYWEGDYEHVRKPRAFPEKRFEKYYNILWKMCEFDDKEKLENVFEVLKNKKVAIYGAGHIAEYIIRKMLKFGIEPLCIYDKNIGGKCINGVPVYQIDNDMKIDNSIEMLLNTLSFYKDDVNALLEGKGYCGKIITLEEVVYSCKS